MSTESYATISSTTAKTGRIVIDGQTFTNSGLTAGLTAGQKKLLFSATKTITHAENGSRSFNLSGAIDLNLSLSGKYWGTITIASTSFVLNTIPRYANITSYSISDTTCIQLKFNYTVDRSIDGVLYKLDGGAWTNAPGGNIITGLVPGSTHTLQISVRSSESQLWRESSILNFVTVALSTISSSADFNLESNLPVTISRPNTSLLHDIWLEAYYNGIWNDVPKGVNEDITTSTTLTPSAAAITALFNAHRTTKAIAIRIRLVVKWGAGGTVQGTSYKTGTATIVNANPTIASVAYDDTNAAVQAILGNNQKILRNRSVVRVIAGLATSQKGAYLASYKVVVGGNTFTATAGSTLTTETGKEVSLGTIDQASNQTAILTVTDTRGNTVTLPFTLTVLDYLPPQILQATAQRNNNYEAPSYMIVEVRRYTVAPVSTDVNLIYLRYRVKENPSGPYGSYITLAAITGSVTDLWQAITTDQYMADYPNDKSYTVELGISDKFTTWTLLEINLPEGIALMKYFKDRIEVGVDLELINNKALILESPNGTRYKITVSDSGVITATTA